MWIANDLGNPVLYRAILDSIDPPMDGVTRVTTLIGPPRIPWLLNEFSNDIILGASEFLWSWQGKCCHEALEKSASKLDLACMVEQRWQKEVDGMVISGANDFYISRGIRDWKNTSINKATKPLSSLIDWERQLNVYAELIEHNGYPVESLAVWALLRDWNYSHKLRRDKPDVPYICRTLNLWPKQQREQYVMDRVRLHKQVPVPSCTAEDTWQNGPTWAVMNGKKKKALKLHSDPDSANTHAASKDDYWVQERPMERPLCKNYCSARFVCEENIHRDEILPQVKKLENLERTHV